MSVKYEKTLLVRMTAEDFGKLQALADAQGVSIAAWVRMTIRHAEIDKPKGESK